MNDDSGQAIASIQGPQAARNRATLAERISIALMVVDTVKRWRMPGWIFTHTASGAFWPFIMSVRLLPTELSLQTNDRLRLVRACRAAVEMMAYWIVVCAVGVEAVRLILD